MLTSSTAALRHVARNISPGIHLKMARMMSGCPFHLPKEGWSENHPTVARDQITAYDSMLKNHPITKNVDGSYSVFNHEDVLRCLTDTEAYSNSASQFVSVPHGLDDPEHSKYRNEIATAFTDEKMTPLFPKYKEIASELIDEMLKTKGPVDAQDFAFKYSARIELALLNWNQDLHEPVIEWTKRNLAASHNNDISKGAVIAQDWIDIVVGQLNTRRQEIEKGLRKGIPKDATDDLINFKIDGKPMPDLHIASLLRNLNMGMVSSMAFNIGNTIKFLAENQNIQMAVRKDMSLLRDATDEITRLAGSLVASKRLTKIPVTLSNGQTIPAGTKVTLNWISCNRDPKVFPEPEIFKFGRKHDVDNLQYGKGAHLCMGWELARIQQDISLTELLEKTEMIQSAPGVEAIRATFPANGFMNVPVNLTKKIV